MMLDICPYDVAASAEWTGWATPTQFCPKFLFQKSILYEGIMANVFRSKVVTASV